MNALKDFFSKDNATAKLSGYLVFVASLITLSGQFFHYPPKTYLIIMLISGVIAVMAQFMQKNRVISTSFWILLVYTVLDYLSTSSLIIQIWPSAQPVIGFLGAASKLFTPWTTQEPSDPKPPTADPLIK
ncbi:hypothetical protein GCM10027592_29460 [Spirosoma flavus]